MRELLKGFASIYFNTDIFKKMEKEEAQLYVPLNKMSEFIDTQIDKAYSAGEEEERKRIFTAYGVPKELEEEFNNQSNE